MFGEQLVLTVNLDNLDQEAYSIPTSTTYPFSKAPAVANTGGGRHFRSYSDKAAASIDPYKMNIDVGSGSYYFADDDHHALTAEGAASLMPREVMFHGFQPEHGQDPQQLLDGPWRENLKDPRTGRPASSKQPGGKATRFGWLS